MVMYVCMFVLLVGREGGCIVIVVLEVVRMPTSCSCVFFLLICPSCLCLYICLWEQFNFASGECAAIVPLVGPLKLSSRAVENRAVQRSAENLLRSVVRLGKPEKDITGALGGRAAGPLHHHHHPHAVSLVILH